MQKIRFKGQEYLLVEGAIATPEQYENFLPSYAHLFENGEILRYGKLIGNKSDIEYLEEIEDPIPTAKQMMKAIDFLITGENPYDD